MALCALLPSVNRSPSSWSPPTISLSHIWLALLLAVLRGLRHWSDVWTLLVWTSIGSLPLLSVSKTAIEKRLRQAGTAPLEQLLQQLTHLLHRRLPVSSLADQPPLAPFASEVFALDESTLDQLHRLTSDLRDIPAGEPQLLVGKLAGLFDLRRQQWVRLQFRCDVLANCKTGILQLLEGLPKASLILCDLGYFSFAFFDWISDQGHFFLSRLRKRTSYHLLHTFYQADDTLDALIFLGASRADRAAHAVRLIQFRSHGQLRRYITNVVDPTRLSMLDVAQLYARRWDIELAFKHLKCALGVRVWWAATPIFVQQQLWAALILAQLLHALHLQLAARAQVDLFAISLPLLHKWLAQPPAGHHDVLALLVERGTFLGVIRPSSRTHILAPTPDLRDYCFPPPDLLLVRVPRSAARKSHARSARSPFTPRFLDHLLI